MRIIPILNSLKDVHELVRFVPYMLDKKLQAEKVLPVPGLEGLSSPEEYNMEKFTDDNQLVMDWFAQLQVRFNQWRCEHRAQSAHQVRLEPTGSRSFRASYTESDLECAIVSEHFADFIDFCLFLNTNYGQNHTFTALKTLAGLPLLIIKNEGGFFCPELSRIYPGKNLPQLEVTFRHPNVHEIIQNAGSVFFAALTQEELESYVFNKRYIELMSRNTDMTALFEGEPLRRGTLEAFKGALSKPLKCLPAGKLQDTPDFNKQIFADIICQPIKPLRATVDSDASFFIKKQANEYRINQQQKWLESITRETNEHCAYLASIGWADRAEDFKVRTYIDREVIPGSINISRFNRRMSIPEAVSAFDPEEKNTLFAQDDSTTTDQKDEIKRSLNIRLYPTLQRIINEHGAKFFLGTRTELQVYSKSIKEKLIIEIEIPSSVKFYLALNQAGSINVYITGIVSHENLIQQLITLKCADIDLQKIPILGDTQQFKSICRDDLLEFKKQASSYLALKNVLIIAGCELENTVCVTIEQILSGTISKKKFSGELVSLSYVHSQNAPNLGFIVLNLNYGEICETQIATILAEFNCIGVFSGSASGYIPGSKQEKLPEIGDRLAVHSAMHYSGEQIMNNTKDQQLHLHVPTIFFETFNWLAHAKESGATTVDVETFYILKAVKEYLEKDTHRSIHSDIGVFISDYVGEKPLRSYHHVFAQYPLALQKFVEQVLVANMTAAYTNKKPSIPTFSSQFISLKPEKIEIEPRFRKEPVVDCIGKYWDKSEFSKRVHTPVTIGAVKNRARFTTPGVPRCIHLPIKLPGSDIRIPAEYQHLSDELQHIINFETSVNPGWNESYAYLTVDQGFVPRSKSQRVPGPHVDGMPRDREHPEAQITDHAYLVTNAIPTMFYTQQFDMNPYDPNKHHFFAIFRALSDESRTITVEPFTIQLMDAYSVHTPTETPVDVERIFVRLEISMALEFDRLGNSVNPFFANDPNYPNYPFNYIPRPIPEHLFVPPSVYLNKPISNQDYIHESIDQFGRANLKAIFAQDTKFKLKRSDYKDLNSILNEIMNAETQGIILSRQGIPHAFFLYKIENKTVKLDTLFTLSPANGQEIMIYGINLLKQIADRLSIQAGLEEGATPITILVNENNENMLKYFLRAARLAKVEVHIEIPEKKLASQENSGTSPIEQVIFPVN